MQSPKENIDVESIKHWDYRYETDITILYEVARPLSNDLKGGYHISCPFGYVCSP